MKDLGFLCEHCSDEGYDVPLRESYEGQDGALVDAQQRALRVTEAKHMQVTLVLPLCDVSCQKPKLDLLT